MRVTYLVRWRKKEENREKEEDYRYWNRLVKAWSPEGAALKAMETHNLEIGNNDFREMDVTVHEVSYTESVDFSK